MRTTDRTVKLTPASAVKIRPVKPGDLRLFRCPKCNDQQRALAKEVAHRCPFNHRWVKYVRIDETKTDP